MRQHGEHAWRVPRTTPTGESIDLPMSLQLTEALRAMGSTSFRPFGCLRGAGIIAPSITIRDARVCARAFVQRLGHSRDWQGLFAFCRFSSYVVPAPASARVEAVQSETVRSR
jgi:hypothetical protein